MLIKCTKPTIVDRNFALIPLTHGLVAIIDPELFAQLSEHKWKAVKSSFCWYAVRDKVIDGVEHRIRMHRIIAETPTNEVCHHRNRRSLDNRKQNLRNMNQRDHQALHNFLGHNRNQHIALQNPKTENE